MNSAAARPSENDSQRSPGDPLDLGAKLASLTACIASVSGDPSIAAHTSELTRKLSEFTDPLEDRALLFGLREYGYGAESSIRASRKIDRLRLPAIIQAENGRFAVVEAIRDGMVQIYDPHRRLRGNVAEPALVAGWNGRVLRVSGAPTRRTRESRTALSMGSVMRSFCADRKLIRDLFLASVLVQLFGLSMPITMLVIIDKVIAHGGWSTLDVMMSAMGIVAVFHYIMSSLRRALASFAARRVGVDLSSKLFAQMLALPLGYFRSHPLGQSVARIDDLEILRGFLANHSIGSATELCFTVLFIALMVRFSPSLTAAVVGALVLQALLSMLCAPWIRSYARRHAVQRAQSRGLLIEMLSGIQTIKSLGIEASTALNWTSHSSIGAADSFRFERFQHKSSELGEFVNRLAIALILWIGVRSVMHGALSMGQMIAFNLLAMNLARSTQQIARAWPEFLRAREAVARVGEVFEHPLEQDPALSPRSLPREIEGRIRFESVSFRYPQSERHALHNLDLEIPAGQVVGILGASGSGKTTLAALLQGFHPPDSGRIRVDGQDVQTLERGALRAQLGVVLQEPFLFNLSVRENISIANPAMSFERIAEAARAADAHDFICNLPKGYDTMVGERGSLLSGGQRQRLAIARALAGTPRILILDEATSALDIDSERRVFENLHRSCGGRTVLIIGHRSSALRWADRVIRLEEGRVVEDRSETEEPVSARWAASSERDRSRFNGGAAVAPS